jgi:chromosome segregation ATPase
MHALIRCTLASGLIGLGGCAVTAADCDPSNADASFNTKFGCNVQGVYAQRVTDKEKVLLDEQEANRLFRSVYAAIEKERASVSSELSQQQSANAELNRSLKTLLGRLHEKAKGNQRVQAQISQLEKDMAKVNDSGDKAVMQKQYELQRLRDNVADLESGLGLR